MKTVVAILALAVSASAQLVTIQGTDKVSDSRAVINQNFQYLLGNKAGLGACNAGEAVTQTITTGVVCADFASLYGFSAAVVARKDISNSFGANYQELSEIATPANPAAGVVRFYAKGGALCSLDSAGNEKCTGSGSASLPTTTKGDLVVHNGTTNVRVPVGTNNQVLTADSAQAAGVAWKDPAAVSITYASTAEAQAGSRTDVVMSPARVADAISYQTPFPAQRAVPNGSGPSTKYMYPRSDGTALAFARPMNPGDGRRYAVAMSNGVNTASGYTTSGWAWGSGNLSGTVSYVAPTAASVGMLKQTSGTADASYAWIGNDANYVIYTAKNVFLDAWVAFGSTTAVRSNIFIADEGWASTRAREVPNKGFGFRFSPVTSSDTAIMCVTGNGAGNTTAVSSGVAMDTSPHQYRIAEDSTNGAIYFYIDDMATPKCTISTNIPTVSTLSLQLTSQVVGTGSAASVAFGWAYTEWDK